MIRMCLSPFDWAQVYDLVEGDFMNGTTIFEMASSHRHVYGTFRKYQIPIETENERAAR